MNKLLKFSNKELANELIRRGGTQYIRYSISGDYICKFISNKQFRHCIDTISGKHRTGELTILVIKEEF